MTEFARPSSLQANDSPNTGTESTHTAVLVPPVLRWLPTAALGSVVLTGAAAALFTPGIWHSPASQSVMTGRWQSSFEHTYDALHPLRTPGVDGFGVMNYAVFGEGRPGVVIGQDGWLYTSEEFQTASSDTSTIQANLREIVQVRDQLRAHDARLMVLIVPAKSRVYPDHLGRTTWPGVKRNVYDSFRQQLQRQGIPTPDLNTALQSARPSGDVFLHTDTHWTPLGARIAAQVLARTTRQMFPPVNLPDAQFRLRESPTQSYSGDLLRYVPLGAWQSSLGPQPDALRTPTIERSETSGSLLGDDTPTVTLVGTSYSANARWGFEAQLKTALHADLINAAQEGKGPLIPMREYLQSTTFRNAPPKLVIWEIPERFLNVTYPKK